MPLNLAKNRPARRRRGWLLLDSLAEMCAHMFSGNEQKAPAPDLAMLEDRVLFSAVPLGDVPQDGAEAPHIDTIDHLLESLIAAELSNTDGADSPPIASLNEGHDPADSLAPLTGIPIDLATANDGSANDTSDAQDATDSTEHHARVELIFIDSAVDDYQQLLDKIQEQASASTQFDVHVLDSTQSGMAQISEALRNVEGVDAVHLVSHGEAGSVHLGSDRLTAENVERFAGSIRNWQNAMDADADLLIYGCDLASNVAGQSLVKSLGQFMEADVAASTDLTGNADLGGDWDLEFSTGSIETDTFRADGLTNWQHLLVAGEFRVNTATVNAQQTNASSGQAIATNSAGEFVVVWESSVQDTSGLGIYFQRFHADGTALGGETRANSYILGDQSNATVAMNDDGDFVIAWQSNLQDGDRFGIYGQRFDELGVAVGSEFRINTTTAKDQLEPAVAIDDLGNFVVTWTSDGQDGNKLGVYGQRFDSAGTKVGTEFRVNTVTTDDQMYSSVATADDGDLVVSWTSKNQDGDRTGVYAQRYQANGTTVGNAFRVNTTTAEDQQHSAVSVGDDGSFVIVWESDLQDTSGNGIFAQRFNADGTREGTEIQVNTTVANDQLDPSVGMDQNGNFVVTWTSTNHDGSGVGAYSRQFDSLGNAISGEVRLNDTTLNTQWRTSLAVRDSGGFAAAWSGNGLGDASGVFARVTSAPSMPTIDLDNDNSAGTLGADYTTSYTEDDVPVLLIDADAVLGDSDSGMLNSLRVIITNLLDGSAEKLAVNTSGTSIASSYSNGVLTLSGTASIAQYQQVLRTVTYENLSQAPNATDRVIRFVPKDATSLQSGNSAYATVAINSINDVPVNNLPAPPSINEDTTLTFSTGNGNALSIVDDAGENAIEVTLTATNGTISLDNKVGTEFRINSTTAGDQMAPETAVAPDGRYVVAWQSKGQDNLDGKFGIYAQLFGADGTPISGELLVNTITVDDQTAPAVAINADGEFVVAWQHKDANGWDIYARTYDETGSAISSATRINATTTDDQTAPAVGMNDAGNFVVSWQSKGQDNLDLKLGVYARVYNLNAQAQTNALLVNTTTLNDQSTPDISVRPTGEFVIAWQSTNQDGSGTGVYGQRFTSAGVKQGSEFLVNSTTSNHQSAPTIDYDANGNFTVAWQSTGQDNLSEANAIGVYAQRFDSSAVKLGSEFQVNTTVSGNQSAPDIAVADDGRFTIVWQSSGQDHADGKDGIYGQDFDAAGSTLGAEYRINTRTLDHQQSPSIGMSANARPLVVWESDNQDGNGDGVYGQRLLPPGAISLTGGDGLNDLTITVVGTVTDINDALDGMSFAPTANYFGTATITITTDDLGNVGVGGVLSDNDLLNINIAAVNDAPNIYVPAAQSALEGFALEFSAAEGTAISFTDVDALSGSVRVTLSVANGTLTLNSVAGLSFISGGNGQNSMSFVGLLADLNHAVERLIYVSNPTYSGPDTLSVVVNDQGNTGAVALSDTASVDISVADYNDPPIHSLPLSQSVVENGTLTFSTANGNAISLSDEDAGTSDIQTTLEVSHGTLTLGTTLGLSFTEGDGTTDSRMTFRGKVSEINAALNGMFFRPFTIYAGPETLRIVTNDLGFTGPDGSKIDSDVLNITVTPNATNAAPVQTTPGPQTTGEETPLVFSANNGNGISVVDDAAGNDIRVTLTATGGTVTLSGTTGIETRVNSQVSDDQLNAAAAMAPSGDYVLVWESEDQDGDKGGIFGQRYDLNGTPLDAEFRVNTTSDEAQTDPAIAIADDGSFVVVWTSANQDGDLTGVFGQRFSASGTPVGAEFQINSNTNREQQNAQIAMDADGDFVVVWQSKEQDGGDWGVYGQRFATNGTAAGSEFRINITTAAEQSEPAVAMDADGDFVVVWQSANQDGDKRGIFARRYNSLGAAVSGEFQVNTIAFEEQTAPNVAMDDTGNFVVVWESKDLDYPDHKYGIYGQRFSAAGSPIGGGQFLVNSKTADEQRSPSIAMDSSGEFVVSWQSKRQDDPDGSYGIFAQRFNANGSPRDTEFQVNTYTQKDQTLASVAMGEEGRFLVVWQSKAQDAADTWGVYSQRYKDIRELVYITGDGTNDAVITFQGDLDEINDAIDGLIFTPNANFDGSAQLRIDSNDLGNTGSGGPRSDSDTIYITVSPVNDAPIVNVPGLQSTSEGTSVTFAVSNGNAISITDVDAGVSPIDVSLTAANGTLTLATTTGLTFAQGDGNADTTITMMGTLGNINAALNGMRFISQGNYVGDASVYVQVNDLGNTGSGGALGDSRAAFITVTPNATNSAPIVNIPGPQRTTVNTSLALNHSTGNDVSIVDDAGGNPVQVTLTVTSGTVTLTETVGPEQLVNTETNKDQHASSMAMMTDGTYIVVWVSRDQDGSGDGIFGQRFDSHGFKLGPEFQVNGANIYAQTDPAVAINANGQFVVAWTSNAQDSDGQGIYARRFTANGIPLGDEFLVNTNIVGSQTDPSVAISNSGSFVVTWQDADGSGQGILAQRYDAAGVSQGSEFMVNSTTAGDQKNPGIAMEDGGEFVVVWDGVDVNGRGIFAQRFDQNGNLLGSEFQVNVATTGNQELAAVTMNSSGSFVIAWQGVDANNTGVFARRYDSSGAAQGGEIAVNTTTTGNQTLPAISLNDSGNFVVVWQGDDANGRGAFGQRFGAAGTRVGAELRLNSTTASDQTVPVVGMAGDGTFAASWTSDNQDGNAKGVYTQRFLGANAVTYSTGDGTSDSVIVFTAKLDIANALIDGMVFTPNNNFTGVAKIQVAVNDLGNTGGGAALSASGSLDIVVGNPPRVNLDLDNSSGTGDGGYTASFIVGGAAVRVADIDAAVDDPNSANLTQLIVRITNRLDGASEILTANTTGTSIVASYVAGTLTLTGPSSPNAFQQVLRTVKYNNAAATPNATTRILDVTASDGPLTSNQVFAFVQVTVPLPIGSISDGNAAADAVMEGAANGTLVGVTALAADPNAGDMVTYGLEDDAGGRFTIDAATGVITVANGTLLDRESSSSHNIVVRAKSSDNSSVTHTFSISVNDVDEFDVGAISDSNAAANHVNENAANGTAVGVTAFATDADATNNTITYSLDDNAGGRFAVNASTGQVTVADSSLLDYEASTSHNITVRATSSDTSFATRTYTISIGDSDEFNVGAISDSDAATNEVNENAANGATVGITAFATDADQTNNSITYALDNNAAGRFAIDNLTGVVTVANGSLLDYETASSHNITVRATSSDSSFSTRLFTINLLPLNDNSPVITSNGGGATATTSINENDTTVTTVVATDADLPAQTLTFSIVGGADAAQFTINASTGVLGFVAAPNCEAPTDANTDNVYNVTVQVSDGSGGSDSQALSVTVNPVNDNSPVFTSSNSPSINENLSVALTLTATDADQPAQAITFAITGGADAAKFAINGAGQLAFVSSPDFELPDDADANNIYEVQVTANDGNGRVTAQSISVTVNNVVEGNVVVVDTSADIVDGNVSSISLLLANRGADGHISLREALLATNNSPNGAAPDQIRFNILDSDAGHYYYRNDGIAGSLSLAVVTALDDGSITDFDPDYPFAPHSWFRIDLNAAAAELDITDAVILDGYSQAGARFNTLAIGDNAVLRIELTSSGADGDRGINVEAGGGGSTICGLAINAFDFAGILTDPGADGVTIQGNFLGTDITGTVDRGNLDAGIQLRSGGNLVGGTNLEDRNVISGNDGRGIATFTFGPIETDNVIENNYIGVDATGLRALGNDTAGVQVWNQDGLQIRGNVIGGNSGDGIWLRTGSAHLNTVIQGNLIGIGADEVTAVGNSAAGIRVETGATSTTIGGNLAGQSNTIAHNGSDGVEIAGGSGTTIRGNSIFSNAGLGIDIVGANGPDANDALDSDGGPNARQNYPVLASAVISGTDITISGTINSTPNVAGILIDFYWSSVADNSEFGEAANYFGSTTVNTDASGNATINVVFAGAMVSPGSFVTASATNTTGNTSEFAKNTAVVILNTPPTITSNAAPVIDENQTVVQTLTATDVDLPAQTVTWSMTGGADAVKFTIDGANRLLFLSAPDHELPLDVLLDNIYEVELTAADGHGGTAVQLIRVTVNPVNEHAPVMTTPAAVNVNENAQLVQSVQASDADRPQQTITYAVTGGIDAGRFAINATTGALTFVTAPDFENPTDADANNVYEVEVTADDNAGKTTAQLISVTVNAVNEHAPVVNTPAAVSINENTTFVQTVQASDADSPAQTLAYSITGGSDASRFAIDSTTGALKFVSAPDFENPTDSNADNVYQVEVTTNDNAGKTTAQLITVAVNPVNEHTPVVTTPAAVSVNENTIFVQTVQASDADSPAQTLTYSITGGSDASRFAMDSTTGALSFVSAPDFENPTDSDANNIYEVEVTVNDNAGKTTAQLISVTVDPVNEHTPVVTTPAAVSVNENTIFVQTVQASDADSPAQTLTYSITGGSDASRFAMDSTTGALSFVSAPDFENPTDSDANNIYEVEVTVNDNAGKTTAQLISVTVDPVNEHTPVVTTFAAVSVNENTTFVQTVQASDADSPAQTLTYSITGGSDASRFAMDSTTGALSFVSAPDFENPTDSDANNIYEVEVTVNDNAGKTTAQLISVTVDPVNEHTPVVTTPAAVSVNENTTFVQTVQASDADSPAQTLTYSITGGSDASRFALDSTTGALSFVSAPDFENPTDSNADNVYKVEVTVNDNAGKTTAQLISVTVNPINEFAPAFTTPAVISIDENTTFIQTVHASDHDAPAQTITYSITGGADAGRFTVTSMSGGLSLVAAADFENPSDTDANNVFEVEVTANDNNGKTATQLIRVTVRPVDDYSPVLISPTAISISENTTLVETVQATDGDLPLNSLIYSITGGADQAKFAINPTSGELTFVSAPNFELPADADTDNNYEVEVMVSDGAGHSDSHLIAVTINNANDIPHSADDNYSLVGNPIIGPPSVNPAPVNDPPPNNSTPEESEPPTNQELDGNSDQGSASQPTPTLGTNQYRRSEPTSASSLTLPQTSEPAQEQTDENSVVAGSRQTVAIARVIRDTQLPAATAALKAYVMPFNVGLLWNDLKELEQDLHRDSAGVYFAAGSAVGVTSALTVGYVLWTIRSGWLITSLLTQMPAWRLVDPLVVLDYLEPPKRSKAGAKNEDDDSLESLLERPAADRREMTTPTSTQQTISA